MMVEPLGIWIGNAAGCVATVPRGRSMERCGKTVQSLNAPPKTSGFVGKSPSVTWKWFMLPGFGMMPMGMGMGKRAPARHSPCH